MDLRTQPDNPSPSANMGPAFAPREDCAHAWDLPMLDRGVEWRVDALTFDACLLQLVWEAESRKVNHGCRDRTEDSTDERHFSDLVDVTECLDDSSEHSNRSYLLSRTGVRWTMRAKWQGRAIRSITSSVRRVLPAFLFDDYLGDPMVPPRLPRSSMFSSPFSAFMPPETPGELPDPCDPTLTALVEYGMLVIHSRGDTVEQIACFDSLDKLICWLESPREGRYEPWDTACLQALALLQEVSRTGQGATTAGISYDPDDQRLRQTVTPECGQAQLSALLEAGCVRHLASSIDALFKILQPRLYHHYETVMLEILKQDSGLRPPLPSVFAEVTFHYDTLSMGSQRTTATKHFAGGWTAVVSLGRYDHTRGGHIVLWDLNAVVELPPRSVFFFPAGVLRYSFLPVEAGEHRRSITFHSGGGMFLWAACGYGPFAAHGGEFSTPGWERWQDAYDLFSNVPLLAMDRW